MVIKNLLMSNNIARIELPKHTILEELEALFIEIDKQGWGIILAHGNQFSIY